ncbi:hypothetical protein CC2G_009638 [Coprinopsis cinerea AmutBmut pab1-1]|nr:hypothetical protein CC2G_009638 [Coprinopsis cinerea AmutBmut pab1-1]
MAPSAAELAMVEAARQDPIVRRDLTNMAMANTGLLFILFYDHLITLPDEVRVIWPMPWKLPKILFMVNRYFVPAFLIFHNFSVDLQHMFFITSAIHCTAKIWTGAPCIFSLACVQGLLMFRVEAIYRGARRVKHFLYAMFGLQLLATGILSGIIMPAVRGYSGQDKVPGCLYIMPQHMEMIWYVHFSTSAMIDPMTQFTDIFRLGYQGRCLKRYSL